jgi:hypothetical protein
MDSLRPPVRIVLDQSRLLGFDQVSTSYENVLASAAKIGVKRMIRPRGEIDSVAMARLTKVGFKDN